MNADDIQRRAEWTRFLTEPIEVSRGRSQDGSVLVVTAPPTQEHVVAEEIRRAELSGYMLQMVAGWQTAFGDGAKPGLSLVFFRVAHRLEDVDVPEEMR